MILFIFGMQACIPGDPLLAAKKLAFRTAVLAPRVPCGISAELIDLFEEVNLSLPHEIINAAHIIHRVHSLRAVVAYDDAAVPVVAHIAKDLGLPGHPVEAANASRDKVLMKARLRAAGIPIAPYTLATDEDDAVDWANRTGYPVVVKPVRGSASQGVIRADSELELRNAYRRVRRIIRENAFDTGERSDAQELVEGYLDGSEFSAELFVSGGRAEIFCLFEKPEPLHGPFFEETLYVTPTRLSEEQRLEIEELSVRAVMALGLRNGPAHCEIRLSSEGAFVLEIGARLIGGACSRVFRYAFGEDIHSYVLRLALGEPISLPKQWLRAAGALMVPIPREGRLRAIRGVEQVWSIPGIKDVLITANQGDLIVPFPEQSCYVGFVTASAATPEMVTDALAKASGAIELELTPLACEHWSRDIENYQLFQPTSEYGIRSLENYEWAEACNTVLPIVADAYFGEFPPELALAKAREYLSLLGNAPQGESSTRRWLVAEGRGTVLSLAKGSTCYLSCLGVLDLHRSSDVAEALMQCIMGLFARHGCKKMEILVDPRQSIRVNLYRRLGFAPESHKVCCSD